MLEKVDLQKIMIKEEFKVEFKQLQSKLSLLQQKIKENNIPVIVLFEGFGASGKGSLIGKMIEALDPRYFKVYSIVAPDESERRKPDWWRFFKKIPAKGNFSIFDRSWYQDVSVLRVEQDISIEEVDRKINDINTFERQLTDDGYLIIKFFLHISQKEQQKRFDELESKSYTKWRVTKLDRQRNKNYLLYYNAYDEMLSKTNEVEWYPIPATDKNYAIYDIYSILVNQITTRLMNRCSNDVVYEKQAFPLVSMPKLADINLDKSLSDEAYRKALKEGQAKLKKLHSKLYQSKKPVVIIYEGWDASGKGGNIKRITTALDPRGYEAIPIAAPDKNELAHHYLWRFFTKLPKSGHIAIFDRSWYGRVMVERIEKFCTTNEWQRAFNEINEFEKYLHDSGTIIVKFWLHIDKDEQLRRFTDRQNTPEKQWKITDEDWRNREKWDEYEIAIDDMLKYTSTDFAPWNIIESKDKKFARIKAMKILIGALERELD